MGKSNFGKMGNVKMRGKKEKVLSCRCCVCRDLRADKEARLVRRELLEDCRELITDNDGNLKLAIMGNYWESVGDKTLAALNEELNK